MLTVEAPIGRFPRHVLAFLLSGKPERESKRKKIHKSDTETVFPPSNVPMDSLPGKARANSLKMHTFPLFLRKCYDLSFAITIHPFSNFEHDNVRGNPVSSLLEPSARILQTTSLFLSLSLSFSVLTLLTSQKRNR